MVWLLLVFWVKVKKPGEELVAANLIDLVPGLAHVVDATHAKFEMVQVILAPSKFTPDQKHRFFISGSKHGNGSFGHTQLLIQSPCTQ